MWKDRAPQVAVAVRRTKPWANLAYLFDLLLRLSLRETYVRQVPPEDQNEVTAEEFARLEHGFHAS